MADLKPPTPFRVPKRGTIRFVLAALTGVFLLWRFFVWTAQPGVATVPQKNQTPAQNGAAAQFVAGLAFDSLLPEVSSVFFDGDTLQIKTTAVPALQRRIFRLMVQYHPLCGAAIVFKPRTGEVLAAVSYKNSTSGDRVPSCENMLAWGEYPAASLFKIVTATGAMQEGLISPTDKIAFNGSNHTLYKNQLLDRRDRWSRQMTFREAFYRSVNPPFAIVGQSFLGEDRLSRAAEQFLFNTVIPFELALPPSRYAPPGNSFELAEAACGFNRRTTLSPVHAALIAGAMGNEGRVCTPFLVREVSNGKKILFERPAPEVFTLASPEAARLMSSMMGDVVAKGTARKSFRDLFRIKSLKGIRFGGKTGSIDSENPRGRCDWFAGFAIPSDSPNDAIAVGIVTAHGPNWTVHSSYLAAEAIRIYYSLP